MQTYIQPGKNISITESLLVHPSHTDGLVNSGDPVLVGRLVGVAATDAAATTDKIAIETEGVHKLSVSSIHNGVNFGETVFIDPSTAVLSDDFTDVPYAICVDETGITGGATGSILVRLFGGTPGAVGFGS